MYYVSFVTSYLGPEVVKQCKKDLLNNVIEGIHNEIFENAKQKYGLVDNILLNATNEQQKQLVKEFEAALRRLERHLVKRAVCSFSDDSK